MVSQGDLFKQDDKKDLSFVPSDVWERLSHSKFRRKFHLNSSDRQYLQEKGLPVILEHGVDFIAKRLAPAQPVRDGRQTPWKGHPVFVAQHATATCCRSCLEKWHHFPKGQSLTSAQQTYVLSVLAGWLEKEMSFSETGECQTGFEAGEEKEDIRKKDAKKEECSRRGK